MNNREVIEVTEREYLDARDSADRIGPLKPDWKDAGYRTAFDAALVLAGSEGDLVAAILCADAGYDGPEIVEVDL